MITKRDLRILIDIQNSAALKSLELKYEDKKDLHLFLDTWVVAPLKGVTERARTLQADRAKRASQTRRYKR